MDLEQRVQLLEQELEILKNQIQHTLVDIQETVLSQTYPSLRAEVSAPVVELRPVETPILSTITSNDSPSQNGNSKGPVPPTDATSPIVRRVSFGDITHPPDQQTVPMRRKSEKSPAQRLETWAIKRINRIGVEQTRWQVYQYADQGRVSAKARDYLLNFIDRHGLRVADNAHADWLLITDANTTTPRQSNRAVKSRKAKSTSRARSSRNNEDPTGDSKNLVLRLIAGIYNAGSGTKWSKKNG